MKKLTKTMMAIAVAILMLSAVSIAGNLEPSGPPAPTMKTLDHIPPTWSQLLPESSRFEVALNGWALLDKETGLVWEKMVGDSAMSWYDANYSCQIRDTGGRYGWRLPTVEELLSLDVVPVPTFTVGNSQRGYWTASPSPGYPDRGVIRTNLVPSTYPPIEYRVKTDLYGAFCVRSGLGYYTP